MRQMQPFQFFFQVLPNSIKIVCVVIRNKQIKHYSRKLQDPNNVIMTNKFLLSIF